MLMNLDYFFRKFGAEDWEVRRDGVVVGTVHGLRRKERQKIDFKPGTDVREGDVLTGKVCGQTYTIIKTDTVTAQGKVFSLEAIYGGEKAMSKGHTVHIGQMVGSALAMDSPGAVQNVTFRGGDRDQTREVIRLILEAIHEIELDDASKAEIKSDAEAADAQLNSPKPRWAWVKDALKSARDKFAALAAEGIAKGSYEKAQEVVRRIETHLPTIGG